VRQHDGSDRAGGADDGRGDDGVELTLGLHGWHRDECLKNPSIQRRIPGFIALY
jgi:hypothetical protein